MKKWTWVFIAFAVTFPAIYAVFAELHLDTKSPLVGAALFGGAIIGAAFLLSWACEVAQMDIPAALALSVLALIAVLPEYAVDFSLTYQAATKPEYQELAVANMIGANRMIVGFACPLIIFLFWFKFGKKSVTLEISQRVEIGVRKRQQAPAVIDPQRELAQHIVAQHHVDLERQATQIERRRKQVADGQIAQAQPGQHRLGERHLVAGGALAEAAEATVAGVTPPESD